MDRHNFENEFQKKLELVKEDLTEGQYSTLKDAANLTPGKAGALICSIIDPNNYQPELDWLYSLTQPVKTSFLPLIKG